MSHDALHLLWTLLAALAAAIFVAARACVRSSGGAVTTGNAPATERVNEPEMKAQRGVGRPHVRTNHAQCAARAAGASPASSPHIVRTITRTLALRQRAAGAPNAAVSASN